MLADYPCYHWVLRDGDSNASWGHLDPASYFANMREVLDIVDEHTEPGPFRDRLYARWYRGKMLNRVEKVHSNPDLDARMALYVAMHELAVERFPDERRRAPAVQPARSARGCCARATTARSRRWPTSRGSLRARARASARAHGAGGVELELEAELEGLRFERDGRARRLGRGRADATAALGRQHRAAAAQAPLEQEEYRVPATVELRLADEPDGRVRAIVAASGRVDAARRPAAGRSRRVRGRCTRW